MSLDFFRRWKTSFVDSEIIKIDQKVCDLAELYQRRQQRVDGKARHQQEFKRRLEELRASLPEEQKAKIAALEAKFSILADLYEAWGRTRTDKVAILSLEKEVNSLKPDSDEIDKKRDGANLAIFMSLVLVIGSIVSVFAYKKLLNKSGPDTWELISYLAPALAAVFAGLTAYIKRWEILLFWAASVLVLSGVCAFFFSKSIQPLMVWNWLIGYAFAATVFWLPYFFLLRRKKPDTRLKKGLLIASFLLLAMMVWFDVSQSHGRPPDTFNNFTNRAICYFFGDATGNSSLGRSSNQSDKNSDDHRSSCTHT